LNATLLQTQPQAQLILSLSGNLDVVSFKKLDGDIFPDISTIDPMFGVLLG